MQAKVPAPDQFPRSYPDNVPIGEAFRQAIESWSGRGPIVEGRNQDRLDWQYKISHSSRKPLAVEDNGAGLAASLRAPRESG